MLVALLMASFANAASLHATMSRGVRPWLNIARLLRVRSAIQSRWSAQDKKTSLRRGFFYVLVLVLFYLPLLTLVV